MTRKLRRSERKPKKRSKRTRRIERRRKILRNRKPLSPLLQRDNSRASWSQIKPTLATFSKIEMSMTRARMPILLKDRKPTSHPECNWPDSG